MLIIIVFVAFMFFLIGVYQDASKENEEKRNAFVEDAVVDDKAGSLHLTITNITDKTLKNIEVSCKASLEEGIKVDTYTKISGVLNGNERKEFVLTELRDIHQQPVSIKNIIFIECSVKAQKNA